MSSLHSPSKYKGIYKNEKLKEQNKNEQTVSFLLLDGTT